jgi:multidrug efflux pump subunit AcrB
VAGPDKNKDEAYAIELLKRIAAIPGAADARLEQSSNYPQFGIYVDRTRAGRTGITEKDVTNSVVVNLASSYQVAPNFWLNPKNGVSYPMVIQTPQYRLDTMQDLQDMPITSGATSAPQLLGAISDIKREDSDAIVSHYAIQPAFDIYAATQDRDLGSVATDVQHVLDQTQRDLPPGATVAIRGQVQTMKESFSGLFFGLAEAVVLIYLLIVVNFHSWSDPFVIVMALPAALAGIAWTLFATHTTLSVPALTGAIMCMGVATANSILVVSFARERLEETGDAIKAAIEAGVTRFRPVLMTALAMIIGMMPMALGLGEGGEQNAPLGRAVVGGLIFATFATLFFVPAMFALIRGRRCATALMIGEIHAPAE